MTTVLSSCRLQWQLPLMAWIIISHYKFFTKNVWFLFVRSVTFLQWNSKGLEKCVRHNEVSLYQVSFSYYTQLSLNGHLYKTYICVKRTPRVGPCLSLSPLFDSLYNKTDISLRRTLSTGPRGVRLSESWLYFIITGALRQSFVISRTSLHRGWL